MIRIAVIPLSTQLTGTSEGRWRKRQEHVASLVSAILCLLWCEHPTMRMILAFKEKYSSLCVASNRKCLYNSLCPDGTERASPSAATLFLPRSEEQDRTRHGANFTSSLKGGLISRFPIWSRVHQSILILSILPAHPAYACVH